MVSKAAGKARRAAVPQRARKASDKEARRRRILDEALALYRSTTYAAVKMADVAERSRLAKGTVFLYFPTKEALFLALLEEQLFSWFERLDARLMHGEGRWTGPRVARTVAESLEGEETLTRLLALLQTVLEMNVTAERVLQFKERLLAAIGHTAELLSRRLPFLTLTDSQRLMRHLYALVTGLRQMADLAPVAREVLAQPHLAPLRVDFSAELTASLTHLLRGLEAR
ncbi:TetR family transcriptional regulator [Myxococcaceae bacterium JPH2]|nr:TetR family transcriptional regulator [Myxococcaceae bacterium JPH2]